VPEPEAGPPRNPFRNEADAFRVLVIVIAATAVVVAVTLVAGTAPGFFLALVLLAVGLWRSIGLIRDWSRRGSAPRRDDAG
jgi:hypothetical protein